MKRIMLSIALMAIAGSGLAQNSAHFKAQALMRDKKDYAQAAEVCEQAIANPKTTKFAEIYRDMGLAYASLFNNELTKAAKEVPFDTIAFCNYLDKAVDAFTNSHLADIKPDAKGRVKPEFEILNKMNLNQMLNYFNYAGIFKAQGGKNEESLKYFEKYINMPKNPIFSQQETDSIYKAGIHEYSQAAFNVSLLNYNLKNYDAVIRSADLALKDAELDKQNIHDAYVMKSNSFLMLKDTVNYAKTLRDAVAATAGEGFMGDLITYYMRRQNRAEAIQMADELIKQKGSDKTSYYIKGCLEMNMTPYNYKSAREAFAKAIELDPDYVEANTNMGVCWIQDVQDKINANYFHLPRGNDNASATKYNNIVNTQINPYYKNALPYLEKARQLAPEKPELWAQGLYLCYTNLKQTAKASEVKPLVPKN
ncbi:hypothetical protein [uncultured Alloprevotella sp.]|jgi:putative tetratricopeptide repeat-containing domain protein|uniref:hypothetical protein n=1 Tax=uncultured Alloprevotella sp. TaxID=1283315 RepID=UPI00325FAA66